MFLLDFLSWLFTGDISMIQLKDCGKVGKELGLSPYKNDRFITFMIRRFGGPSREMSLRYIKEWAWRFNEGIEGDVADRESRSVLDEMKCHHNDL